MILFKPPLKKAVLIVLLIAFIPFSYLLYYRITEKKSEDFISPQFLLIFQTGNLFSLFGRLNESRLLDALFYNREMKEIYKVLVDVKSQLSRTRQKLLSALPLPSTVMLPDGGKPVVLFNTGPAAPVLRLTSLAVRNIFSDSDKFSFSREGHEKSFINKITLLKKRQSFYYAQVNNILLFSTDRPSLVRCLDDHQSGRTLRKNENFLQVRSQTGSGSFLRIYFNVSAFLGGVEHSSPGLFRTLRTLSVLDIAGADFILKEDSLKIRGFFSTSVTDETLLKFFLSGARRTGTFFLLPRSTVSFATVAFEDFRDLWNVFNRILLLTDQKEKQEDLQARKKALEKVLGISMEELLFSWLDREITAAVFSPGSDPVLLLGVRDPARIKAVFKKLHDRDVLKRRFLQKYQGVEIEQLKLSSFFELLSGILAPNLEMPCFVLFHNTIMLCRSPEPLKLLVDAILREELLAYEAKAGKLSSELPPSNLLAFWELAGSPAGFLEHDNLFTRIIKNYGAGMLSLEFVDRGIRSTLLLTGERPGGLVLMKEWPVDLKSVLWSAPLACDLDRASLEEVIQGAETGKIFALDVFAESVRNWPVKMSGDLRSSPFFIPHPEEGFFIGAVSGSGQFHIWARDGLLKEGFPVNIPAGTEKTPLVRDINNDNKPEIILAGRDGKVYALDGKGSVLPGFPAQIEGAVNPDLLLLDMNRDGKMEILCSAHSPAGELFFINDTGEVNRQRFLETGELNPSPPVVVEKGKSFRILMVTGSGYLHAWDESLKEMKGFPLSLGEKFVNPPGVADLDHDGKEEIVLVSSSGRLWITDFDGRLMAQVDLNFKPLENERIVFSDVDKDGIKEIIVPGTDNFIRFYHAGGELVYKVSGSFSPVITDMDKDGRNEILAASDDGFVYLYKAP